MVGDLPQARRILILKRRSCRIDSKQVPGQSHRRIRGAGGDDFATGRVFRNLRRGLGEEDALREIEASGDLRKWRPGPLAEKDFSRKLWLQLRENRLGKSDPTKVLLGCGTDDRLAVSNRLFAREFLKSGEQEWIPGGHDWPAWRPLFESLSKK
jgi:hypothetical protein